MKGSRLAAAAAVVLAAIATAPAHAQEQERSGQPDRGGLELGMRGGMSVVTRDGNSQTIIGLPHSGYLGPPTVYATAFVGERTAIEPQLGIARGSSSFGGSQTLATFGLQLMQFGAANPAVSASPFAFATAGLVNASAGGGHSSTLYQLGGGAGYRTVVRDALGLRVEGRYRRYFFEGDAGHHEFSLLLGFGAVLRP